MIESVQITTLSWFQFLISLRENICSTAYFIFGQQIIFIFNQNIWFAKRPMCIWIQNHFFHFKLFLFIRLYNCHGLFVKLIIFDGVRVVISIFCFFDKSFCWSWSWFLNILLIFQVFLFLFFKDYCWFGQFLIFLTWSQI